MGKMTIDSYHFTRLMCAYRSASTCPQLAAANAYEAAVEHIDSKLAEAYERGRRDALKTLEPVAVIGADFKLLYSRMNWSSGLWVGDLLYKLPKEPT